VASLDATVVLERPKLSPHKDLMRANLAAALGVPVAVVNVKGKTHEKVDAVGEGRAVEVHCVVLLSGR
jgi:2-C-methyl-D-erythritol 2,4-cyclodiphosphate synthase